MILTALSIGILAFWVLLLIQTIVNLRVIPMLGSPSHQTARPLVSVIIPARNEEQLIEPTVRAFLAQDYGPLEIIVVNDGSEDGTAAVLSRFADARLKVISGEELPAGWLGKPWALHQGVQHARGELLLFVDADLIYAPNAVTAMVHDFLSRDIGLLSIFPRMIMHGYWENVMMPCLALAGFVYIPIWADRFVHSPRLALGGGTGSLLRRQTYQTVGGHEALRNAVIDDVGLAQLVRRHGATTVLARAENYVTLRMYRGLGEIVDGFTKNSSMIFSNNLGLVAAFLVAGAVFNFLPYGLLLLGIAQWLESGTITTAAAAGATSVALMLLIRLLVYRHLRYSTMSAILGHLPMYLLFGVIMVRSAWQMGVRGRLVWRGRDYAAAGLRFGGEEREK